MWRTLLLILGFLLLPRLAGAADLAFALGIECAVDDEELERMVPLERADTSVTWGHCSLHAVFGRAIGVRCILSPEGVGRLAVRVVDERGRLVHALFEGVPRPPLVWVWNGKDQRGHDVPAGAYGMVFESDRGTVAMPFCKRTGMASPHLRRNTLDSPIAPPQADPTG